MKAIVRKIDRALKRIYNLENRYWAERFLIRGPLRAIAARHAGLQGAIFVQNGSLESLQEHTEDLSLGIYFSEPVRRELSDIRHWKGPSWSTCQLSAFAVAAEEVSHFNYLIQNAVAGRAVSQLELEMQGEVDKFLLAFFALSTKRSEGKDVFQALFEQLFERFHWAEHLTDEQRDRYAEANQCAKQFLLKCRTDLSRPSGYEKVFRILRRFYRLSASEKISFIRG